MRIYLSQLKMIKEELLFKKIRECVKVYKKPGTNCRQKILNTELTYFGRS